MTTTIYGMSSHCIIIESIREFIFPAYRIMYLLRLKKTLQVIVKYDKIIPIYFINTKIFCISVSQNSLFCEIYRFEFGLNFVLLFSLYRKNLQNRFYPAILMLY